MNNHLLSQFFNVDEEQLLAAAESFASTGPQIWPASNPVYVKMEDSGDDASSNASWGFTATSTTPMDYDDSPAMINCIPGGLAQISLPGSSRSPSPDMTLPGGFNFAAASQQQQQKPVSAIPAHLRPREAALNPSSLVSPPVVPTLLQQPSPIQTPKSNGRKLNSTTSAPPPSPPSPAPELNGQPHPYSISPSNTTALFTRASSVSSTTSGPTKKGRAPPSGPISTKDFVPPDVSGLTKREARLVKNRAAAFLSRQRKREEFEGLEARVEVLETDNARLYKELEAYRSGASSSPATAAAPALAPSGATPAALQAELVGLRRQLGARDQELAKLHGRMQAINAEANAERERVAQKDAEIAQLKRQLASRGVAAAPAAKEDDSDSDSEDAQSTTEALSGKKDLKSAGSMAFMVLLFSLSSLLTSAESSGSAKPPVASERVRRPGMHHRDSSRTYLDLPQQAFSSGLAYDSFLSTSDSSMMLAPAFGFDEDSLLGGSSAFVGLSSSAASPSQPPRQQQQQRPKVQDSKVADSLASAISSVKSISPEEFEFDFTVPSSSSSSSLDSFAFPARPKQQAAGKKIRVCVKSALPLNLNLDALSKAAGSSSSAAPTASSQKAKECDIFASSVGYRETDDLLGDSGFWSAAASTFGGSVSPSSVLSPTMSTASSESRKRKRVVVEINPRGGSRRRLSEDDDGDDEMDTWDVKFSEDDDLVVGVSDDDVQMRL